MAEAEFFDLTPRRNRFGLSDSDIQRSKDKENSKPTQDDCLSKAAQKRQQVLDQKAASQADERSRLCIFQHEQKEGSAPVLTVPHGPNLMTASRCSSRSVSRSRGSPGQESHSVGNPCEASVRSRAASRERSVPWTPELSIRSLARGSSRDPGLSVRSQMSVRSHISTASVSSHVRGRVFSTASLTFPRGPHLSTETRSQRSRSTGCRTPSICTPERSVRSPFRAASACSSERSTSRLTQPMGPNLVTALRSRSGCRSVGARTPSAHSAASRQSSTDSRQLTVPVGPNLATELRARSRSVSRSRPECPGTPDTFHSCSSARACSVRSATRELTVPVAPYLRTEVRSWSRGRCTRSSCGVSNELPSEDKHDGVDIRSRENLSKALLRGEQPSGHTCEQAEAAVGVETCQSGSPALEACHLDAAVSISKPILGDVKADVVVAPEGQLKADFSVAEVSDPDAHQDTCIQTKETAQEAPVKVIVLEREGIAVTSSGPKVSHGKLSPSLRAAYKKEQVLAQVAQDQASKKNQLFVFGKSSIKASTSNVQK